MDAGEGDEARNSTVDRALRVLEAFVTAETELGVLEIARQLDLDKSVIHRILSTLVRRRFLEQDPVSRRYRVGLRAWELGRRYLAENHLEELAEKELTRLVRTYAYATAYIATLDGGDVVVLNTMRGPGPINVYIDLGTRMAAELTATGRSLLAYVPPAQLSRLVTRRRQAGLGGREPWDLDDLAQQLATIRQDGYSLSRGEYALGIGTVAVAVQSPDAGPLVSLSIDFLIGPETENLWDLLPTELARCAREIERVMQAS